MFDDFFSDHDDLDTKPARPEGYQRIETARLPAEVRRFVQSQQMEHYWQQARVDRQHWTHTSPTSGMVLVIFDGKKAQRITRYQRSKHDSHQLFVFRQPTQPSQQRFTGTHRQEPAEDTAPFIIENAMDTLDAQPIKLELDRLDWDKRQYLFDEEPVTGWFTVNNAAGHEGRYLKVIVKDTADEQGKRILSQFIVTLKKGQRRYAFTVQNLKASEVNDPRTGDLRFSVKNLRGEGKFSGPATLLKQTQLTIAQIAEQLIQIEQAQDYEQARYAAKQLDYDAMCKLVHDRDLDDNNPNLMPSRFMLLPGASDAELEANGNLDRFPWPVHEDGPQYFSVAFLQQCLQLGGYLESDAPLPQWRSATDDRKDEFDHPIDPILPSDHDAPIDEAPNNQQAEFNDALKQAYDRYRAKYIIKPSLKTYQPKQQGSYTVKPEETLHSIAEAQGYPYWTMLWQANKNTGASLSQLTEATKLILPEQNADDLRDWLIELDEHKRYWTQQGFFFPAHYVAYALVNDQQQPKTGLNEHPEWVAAQRQSDGHRFYHLSLNQNNVCTVMMPNHPELVLGLVRGQALTTAQALGGITPVTATLNDITDSDTRDNNEDLFFNDDIDYANI